MASFSVSNSNGRFTLTLTVNEDETSIENNTSTLSYSLVLTANTSYDFSDYHIGYLITLDGGDAAYSSRADSPQYSCGANSSVTIASGNNFGVAHNSDGSKTISVSFSIDMESDDWTPGPLSGSGSMALTTIPRASVLNAISNFDVDSGLTVRMTKYYSGFRDDLSIKYNGTEVRTSAGTYDGEKIVFTASQLSVIYGLMSTVKSGTFTLTITTYNGTTAIGTSSTTATGSISNANPTLSASVVDVNSTTVALTGSSAKLVKYKSTARVTISASGNKGASISSKVVNGTAVSGTTLDIANISTTPLTVTATDSRGNSTTVTLNPVVIAYVPLTCSASFYRPEPTTGEVACKFSGNFFNGSFGASSNSLTLSWAYRLKGASSWTSGGSFVAGTAYTLSGNTYASGTVSLGTGFDYTASYEFILYFADKLTSSNTGAITVTRGLPVMDWGKNDVNINGALGVTGGITGTTSAANSLNFVATNEVRFGNYPATKNDCWFNYKFADGVSADRIATYRFGNGAAGYADIHANSINGKFNGMALADTVTAMNESSGWFWRKWADGRIEAFTQMDMGSPTLTYDSTYDVYHHEFECSLPSGLFSNIIMCNATPHTNGYCYGGIASWDLTKIIYRLISATYNSPHTYLNVYVLGQ